MRRPRRANTGAISAVRVSLIECPARALQAVGLLGAQGLGIGLLARALGGLHLQALLGEPLEGKAGAVRAFRTPDRACAASANAARTVSAVSSGGVACCACAAEAAASSDVDSNSRQAA